MEYKNIQKAVFFSRPNRFIAEIEIEGKKTRAHVKNTGRCRELLLPGAEIFVQKAEKSERKTQYDLISVYKGNRLINIDSQAPNKVFFEWLKDGNLFSGIKHIKPEYRYGNSRFDFYAETEKEKCLIEVKGVTLEENGKVRFPDAPTERGVKHIYELIEAKQQGYGAYIVFVIQMEGVTKFLPNDETHKAFGDALRKAKEEGVHILAFDCRVTETGLFLNEPISVEV